MLRSVDLKVRYSSSEDIASAFFVPCIKASLQYDRAVGYFSSAFYLVVGMPIASFAERGGRIRVVCSPQLTPEDIEALRQGYREKGLSLALDRDLGEMADEPVAEAATRLLATMVSQRVLDIRVAFRPAECGIFHDKVGIFTDQAGDRVSFSGSANETWAAWSGRGNFEGFHTHRSWVETDHVHQDVEYFERLWANHETGLEVVPFPEVTRERLIAKAHPDGVEAAQEELERHLAKRPPRPALRRHQKDAVENWRKAGYRGLIEHATGSGKTITALSCLRLAAEQARPCLVVVPTRVLLRQWRNEIRSFFGSDANLLLAGDMYNEWKSGSVLRDHLSSSTAACPMVISTLDTASSPPFLERLEGIPGICLVVDEVHRAGSPKRRQLLTLEAEWRLGLSATLEREGDPEGTRAIREYFGAVVPPVYTLAHAVRDGHLAQYRYFIHIVSLDDDERTQWQDQTTRIARLAAQTGGEITERLRQLLIARARIVRNARRKVTVASNVLEHHYRDGDAWLVYCDNAQQVRAVRAACEGRGIRTQEYHTQMAGDGSAVLEEFSRDGGILVAINCLDEGVDIPRISHALILASSTTRRQFIQRRGRVLRKHESKHRATIHDLVVDTAGFREPDSVSFIKTELARALEFVRSAVDSAATEIKIRDLAAQAGIALHDRTAAIGLEDLGDEERMDGS